MADDIAQEDLLAEKELEKFGYKQELKRALSLWELTAFGLNYMIPIAPAIIFGFVLTGSGGTVALPYAIAGVAMFFTAMSYGVMVQNYPLAGSIYNYVSRGWNPHLGFVAGWILILDYVLIPTVTSMSAALYIQQLYPAIPYWLLLLVFAVAMGLINLFGVELMAKGGLWMLLVGEVVIFVGFAVWAYAIQVNGVGTGTLISSIPLQFDSVGTLMTATSMAVLSYLGFDAITTLSEETHNPRKDVPRAIYLSVVIGAGTMVLTGYLGVLVIPNWRDFASDANWVNTTLFQVAKLVGGGGDWWFSYFYLAGYVLAMGVFNIVATAAGARLLYGMGRDGLIPRPVFAAINKRWQTPHWNIILIVLIEYVLGMRLQVADITNLINYGALGGFAALNLGVVWLYYVKKKGVGPLSIGNPENWQPVGTQHLRYFLAPIIGFLVVAWVFISLDTTAKIVGTIFLVIGVAYEAIITKGWRELPPQLEL
jgi:putrescine importer